MNAGGVRPVVSSNLCLAVDHSVCLFADHWVIDLMICNLAGMTMGMLTCKYFECTISFATWFAGLSVDQQYECLFFLQFVVTTGQELLKAQQE